jgi:hypothetical protein
VIAERSAREAASTELQVRTAPLAQIIALFVLNCPVFHVRHNKV